MNPATLIALAFAALLLFEKKKPAVGGVPGNDDIPTPPAPGPDKPAPVPPEAPVPGDMKNALRAVIEHDQSPAIARLVEKVFRLETANFTSKLYKLTNAAGQKAVTKEFPFGWRPRGTVASDYLPPVYMTDTGEGAGSWWVAYKQLPVAVGFLAEVIRERGGNAGAWNSSDQAAQTEYVKRLQGMATTFADAAWADYKAGQAAKG